MVTNLEGLMNTSGGDLTQFEAEVVEAQRIVMAIKEDMQTKGISLDWAHGFGWEHGSERTEEEEFIIVRSYGRGYAALGMALLYLTQEKTVPLNAIKYIEITDFVERNYPETMWKNGLWGHRFNKVVNEWEIPIDANLADTMDENQREKIRLIFHGAYTKRIMKEEGLSLPVAQAKADILMERIRITSYGLTSNPNGRGIGNER